MTVCLLLINAARFRLVKIVYSCSCDDSLSVAQACPCKPENVCASDNLGLFADGNCSPGRFHWFWPHGGKPPSSSYLLIWFQSSSVANYRHAALLLASHMCS